MRSHLIQSNGAIRRTVQRNATAGPAPDPGCFRGAGLRARLFGLEPRLAALVMAALLTAASSVAGTIRVVNLPTTGTDAATGISTTNSYLC